MKLIIAGSRDFNDYSLLEKELNPLNVFIDEIVSGNARGADTLGERYSLEYNIPLKIFKADWNNLGKRAGIVRNHQMGEYADLLLAFWDGKSKGTKDMIDYMKKLNKKSKVILYNQEDLF